MYLDIPSAAPVILPVMVMVKRFPRVNVTFEVTSAAIAGMTMVAMKKGFRKIIVDRVCFCIILILKNAD